MVKHYTLLPNTMTLLSSASQVMKIGGLSSFTIPPNTKYLQADLNITYKWEGGTTGPYIPIIQSYIMTNGVQSTLFSSRRLLAHGVTWANMVKDSDYQVHASILFLVPAAASSISFRLLPSFFSTTGPSTVFSEFTGVLRVVQ